jgi:type IV conjugative transfer system coupling protein TraD
MSMSHASAIKFFTRGGQTFLHNFRMIVQIIKRVLIAVFLVFILLAIGLFFRGTTEYQRYIGIEWLHARTNIMLNDKSTQPFIYPNGQKVTASSKRMLNAPFIQQGIHELQLAILRSLFFSTLISIGLLTLITVWLKRRGQDQTSDKMIKGDTLVDSEVLAQSIKRQHGSKLPFQIANIPLPPDAERSHFLIHGSTGTGKSVSIRQLLDTIRQNGDRVILYDKSCDFIRYYFQNDSDVLLNSLDERGAPWDLWNECRSAPDYDNLATALIPSAGQHADPFWINAARTIFSATAYAMRDNPNRSTLGLLRTLLSADSKAISAMLKGTEAESLVADQIEKTTLSIKSVLATNLKSLKYVKESKQAFSIRKWVQNDKQKNWLFISSLADQHETLKPLITLSLDIAINALMSLEPSNTRRIWIILDELASLNKLPYLNSMVAEARKFGACVVLGLQGISQVRAIYGRDGAEEISGLCNTRLFFRSPTSDTASWVSKELGLCEFDEVREGYSYGEESIRAGVSLSHQRTQRPLVNYSEVMALKNLEAYLRLPGDWPVTKLKIPYRDRKPINTPFIPREKSTDASDEELQQVEKLIAAFEKLAIPPSESPELPQKECADEDMAKVR